MKSNEKEFQYNNKDFIFVKEIKDKKYGKILKAISKEMENFEILYFRKEHKNLSLITDEEVVNYIYKKYDEIHGDVAIYKDDLLEDESFEEEL